MDDPLDAFDGALHRGRIGKVGRDELLVGGEIGRSHAIAEAQDRIDALQQFSQPRAYAAGSSRDETTFHCGAYSSLPPTDAAKTSSARWKAVLAAGTPQ
jgi:hypothetical protein